METKTQDGYLVLADISGFTSFLATTELEHAHEILSDLLELIISCLTPTLTLSKLEGDAVFVYGASPKINRGETMLELVETTYVAFRDRLETMHRASTCVCRACQAIPTLDLKFLIHHGDYILQRVAGATEVLGSDVNLIHRLLKNHISEETGWRAYALFTQQSLEHMGIPPEGMLAQTEIYEHLGEVQIYSFNLQERYKELTEARLVFVTPTQADVIFTFNISAPPPIVWEWLNDPDKRLRWERRMGATAVSREGKRNGRTVVGSRNHCAHGKQVVIENILDWKPFDYYTCDSAPSGQKMAIRSTYQLDPTTGGTLLHINSMVIPQQPRWVSRPLCKLLVKMAKLEPAYETLVGLLKEETERAREQPQNKP